MEQDKKEQRISIRFPDDVLQELRELAKQHERSFNGEVVWALREYIKKSKEKSNRV